MKKDVIFLSHKYEDKPIVETVAFRLRELYGEDRIFYDSWSIKPGDSIIEKINEGLTDCKLFFLFVSKKSLTSDMVSREWQSALYRAINHKINFIPVLLEHVEIPAIMADVSWIDLFNNGIDNVVAQMVDAIDNVGLNCFLPIRNNIQYSVTSEGGGYLLCVKTTIYSELCSDFLICSSCSPEELIVGADAIICNHEIIELEKGQHSEKGYLIGIQKPLIPGFVLRIHIKHKNGQPFTFVLYHRVGELKYNVVKHI